MEELICPKCNIAASKVDDVCPQCGAYVELEVAGKDAAIVGGLIVGSFALGLLAMILFFTVSFFVGGPLILLSIVLFFVGDHQKNKRSQHVWYIFEDGRKYRL